MEARCFYETLVEFKRAMRGYITGDRILQFLVFCVFGAEQYVFLFI
jgi:hypothetical protein